MSQYANPRRTAFHRFAADRISKVRELVNGMTLKDVVTKLRTSTTPIYDILSDGLFSREYVDRLGPEIDRVYAEYKATMRKPEPTDA